MLLKNQITLAILTSLILPYQAFSATENKAATLTNMEVIEVTARKTIESIQEVPLTVKAVSGEFINRMDIHSIDDLSVYISGLEQPNYPNHSRLILRGVSSGDNASFEQSVGTYIDGVYRGRMNQQRAGFFDMARVEVLTGPQVSLYGNSSIGGAVSMLTNRPEFDDDLSGYITAKYETKYQQSQYLSAINIPVNDELAFRIAGKYRNQAKGIAYNHYPTVDDFDGKDKDDAFRISALWQANDDLQVYFRHGRGNYQSFGSTIDPLMHLNTDLTPNVNSPLINFGMGDNELFIGNSTPLINDKDFSKAKTNETMLELVYNFSGRASLTAISAYSQFDYNNVVDVDTSPLSLLSTEQLEDYQQFSQELRFAYQLDDQTDLLAGIYYQKDTVENDFYSDVNMPLLMTSLTPLPESVLSTLISPVSRHNTLDQSTKQSALFAQVNHYFSQDVSVSLGGRYVKSTKIADQILSLTSIDHIEDPAMGEIRDFSWLMGLPPGSLFLPDYYMSYQLIAPGATPHAFENMQRDENHMMLQSSIRYQADNKTMYYATWANGAKVGGFDLLYEGANYQASPKEVEFEDEHANTFEIGFKRDWSTVRFNLAAFYGQYKDLQVSIFTGSIGFNVGNAAKSIQKGLDAELIWQLSDNLSIMSNIEYLDNTYDEFKGAACSFSEDPMGINNGFCDWKDKAMPWVPKLKAVIVAEYLTQFSSDYLLTHLLGVSYKSKHSISSDNDSATVQSAYGLVDYSAQLTSGENNWSLALSINNVFDKDFEFFTSKIPLNNGAYGHGLHKGREVTLEASYQF